MLLRPVLFAVVTVLLAGRPAGAVSSPTLQGGIRFIAIQGSTEGTVLALEDAQHNALGHGTVDSMGSLIFRDLTPGAGYVVRDMGTGTAIGQPVTVRAFEDLPDPSLYTGQTLAAGLQYIQTRDGTLLAAMVRAPLGKTMADGPFPTVVEYSGYAVADPDNPQPSSLMASALGYATVGVNMRGSGCSGGVLDLFDYPTTADGYDIIETVAAQSWVKGGKVGMVGISFPGISQLFVGGAQPPHLAALAPFSTIADIYRAPGFPGGIFNTGFAASWLQERKDDAEPAPTGGQSYARKRVMDGDTVCLANQALRLQTLDPLAFTQDHPYYEPAIMSQRSPINWVDKIQVPMLFASAFQDEQTGGDFASMLSRFPRRKDVKIHVTNGVHTSALDPETLFDWIAFLDIYVAQQVPNQARLAAIAPIIYPQILGGGTPTPPLPADEYADLTGADAFAQAKKRFEKKPFVRALMENGAGSDTAGLPAPTFHIDLKRWPAPNLKPTPLYFAQGGVLSPKKPKGAGDVDGFHPDPSARPEQTLPGTGPDLSWAIIPPYDWAPLVANTALAYATPALKHDVIIGGPSSVDLYLRSTAADTDLQVTLSEIRPDGNETYVQNGWLRASHRKLDDKTSTILEPRPTHLQADAANLPAGEFTLVRIGLFSAAHVFRKGSRIRISVEAPGGDRPRWDFGTFVTNGSVLDEVARMPKTASRIVLPVLRGVKAPATLPPCPGLRGEPCRTYEAASNGG